MKSKTLSLKTIIKEFDFLKRTVIVQMKRLKKKDLLLLVNKLKEKIPDSRKAKEDYQSFIRKKTIQNQQNNQK